MHEFRQVFLLGLIAGVSIEIFGVAALSIYFSGNQTAAYLTGGVCSVVVGIMFLAKSVPVFIPIKKQPFTPNICPNCGSIQNANATICDICKQQLEQDC
ncbi:MAG: hypothetical protein NWE93_14690 [Candidatus Bathyarchaeota archaeon]|nr:hypothetical protein [Candidatus Bathyarchaeota archaeon]